MPKLCFPTLVGNSLMLRGCCAARDITLSLEREWYETLIYINQPCVAFQVQIVELHTLLKSALLIYSSVSCCFFPVVIFSVEKNSSLKQEFLCNVYGVHFSYFILAREAIVTPVLAALQYNQMTAQGKRDSIKLSPVM